MNSIQTLLLAESLITAVRKHVPRSTNLEKMYTNLSAEVFTEDSNLACNATFATQEERAIFDDFSNNSYRETSSARLLKVGRSALCVSLCDMVITLLKITPIFAARNMYASCLNTNGHAFIVLHHNRQLLNYQTYQMVAPSFNQLSTTVQDCSAAICDPWLYKATNITITEQHFKVVSIKFLEMKCCFLTTYSH